MYLLPDPKVEMSTGRRISSVPKHDNEGWNLTYQSICPLAFNLFKRQQFSTIFIRQFSNQLKLTFISILSDSNIELSTERFATGRCQHDG